MKILIIDDHEIVRRGLKAMVSEQFAGAEFGEASTVPTGRELLARKKWGLILVDIHLPGGSGLDLLAEAKRLCPATPVLVLSSYPEEEFAVRAFKLGAAGYLTKASVADEVPVAIKKILAGGKYVSASLAEKLASSLGQPASDSPHELLSTRELEVLQQVASGRSIKEIASGLSLSEKTIGTYRSRISEKLGVTTNVELTRYALKHHLVD